jgi:hypothetical protein
MRDSKLVLVLGVFAAALIAVILIAALSAGYQASVQPRMPSANAANTTADNNRSQDIPLFGTTSADDPTGAHSTMSWKRRIAEMMMRLMLAVLFSSALAFRPRSDVPLFRRSLFVSQTQILLAMVAAALMMIVGDSAARAFGIFAAASLVRFRTNIKDPKEITVLLISLAIGLAAGVGRWELGLLLCVFALGLLWLLEYNEAEKVFRSMELTVKTRLPDHTQDVLKAIFTKLKLDAEVREFEPLDEKSQIGSIVYYLNLPLRLTTDYVSDRIIAADPDNIEGIQWSKTKAGNIYQ